MEFFLGLFLGRGPLGGDRFRVFLRKSYIIYLPRIHTIFRRVSYLFFLFGSFSWLFLGKGYIPSIFIGFIVLVVGFLFHELLLFRFLGFRKKLHSVRIFIGFMIFFVGFILIFFLACWFFLGKTAPPPLYRRNDHMMGFNKFLRL